MLFSSGSRLVLADLLHTFYINCYSLTIGKCFSVSRLGFSNRSYTLAQFPPTNFTGAVVCVVHPIQCRHQDDMPRLRSIFLKYIRMSYYLIFPVMVAMTALTEPPVEIALTDKWFSAVPYLQILCVVFIWNPMMKTSHSVSNAKGRTDYLLYVEIWKKLTAFAMLFATIPLGISATCWGLMLYSFADMGTIIYYSRKLMKTGYLRQLYELLPVLLLNGAMGICPYLITLLSLSAQGQLLLGVPPGLIIYVVGSCVSHMSERQMLFSVLNKSGRCSFPSFE